MPEPILQWRKLSGDTTRNKDTPWLNHSSPRDDNQRASTQENKVKVSRQDFINEEGRRRRENVTKKTNHSKSNTKTHITQHKKTQYTHLVSNRGGLVKNDDRPKVYISMRKEEEGKKQAKTGLWLNDFTIAD